MKIMITIALVALVSLSLIFGIINAGAKGTCKCSPCTCQECKC